MGHGSYGAGSAARALNGTGLWVAAWLLLGAAPAIGATQDPPALGAILQGLNKTTARVSTFEAPLDETVRFGSLEIVTRACHKKPPTETPESTVFLEIVDVRPDSAAVPVFTGWMFASSPAVSALEHPVYDVWVVDCRALEQPTSAEVSGETETEPDTEAVPASEPAATAN